MFVACGIWCLADVSSVSPSSEQTHYRNEPDLVYHVNTESSKFIFGVAAICIIFTDVFDHEYDSILYVSDLDED